MLSNKEHTLLHREEDALRACGHKDWRKCQFCSRYDEPSSLQISKDGRHAYHRKCRNKYQRNIKLRKVNF